MHAISSSHRPPLQCKMAQMERRGPTIHSNYLSQSGNSNGKHTRVALQIWHAHDAAHFPDNPMLRVYSKLSVELSSRWRTDTHTHTHAHTHTHLADNYHVGSITRQWAASASLLALPKILTQRLRGSAIPGLPFAAKLPNLSIRWQTPQDPKRGERRENYEEGRSQRKAQNHTKGVP